MKLLRLTPALKATSSSYNQFSLGFKDKIDQTVGSLLKHDVIIDEKIKVFHGNGSAFKMLMKIRKFIHNNNYDVIHIHNGTTGFIFLLAIFPFKYNLLKKTVFTIHNSWNVFKLRNQLLNLIVMIFSYQVCTCGKSSQESLPKIIKFLIGKKSKVIVNGFDNKRIDRIANNKIKGIHFTKSSRLKILYIGSLNRIKNQISLLEALNSTRLEAEIIFLGDGEKKDFLKELSKKISKSIKIEFKGLVSREITIEHMLEADVYISLSKGEGLPIAALEAMYAGCFMLLSKIPPHIEISPPSERCYFVNTECRKEIINSLNFLSANSKYFKNNREKSRSYSINNFGISNMLKDYKKVYESILEQ